MLKNKTLIILIVIIIFGSLLRFWHLGEQSLWIDEGFTINASLSIIEKGLPILDSEKLYDNGTLYNYITAISIKFFGFTPFSPWQARLPAALFGILLILSVYLLSSKLFNKETAFLSAGIIAFSDWQIAWSRQARGYAAVQFFITLSFYFLWLWLEKKKIKYLFLFFFSFLFSALSHNIAVVFLPAFILIFIFYPKKRLNLKQWVLIIFIFFIISLFLLAVINFPKANLYNLFSYYVNFAKKEFLFFIIGAVMGLFLGIFNKKRYSVISVSILILSYFFIISFFIHIMHFRYLLPLFPFIIILFCYGIETIFGTIKKLLKIKPGFFSFFFSFSIIVLFSFSSLNFIPKKNYSLEPGSPQPNFKEAYKKIKEIKSDDDLIISPYTALSKIYLNDIGLWLPISLSGRKEELEKKLKEGKDYYTGSPIISNDEKLLEIINSKNGFIVIDQMAKNRIGKTFNLIDDNLKTKIIYHSKGPKLENIWVYQF